MANLCFLVAFLCWTGITTLLVGSCLKRLGVLRISNAEEWMGMESVTLKNMKPTEFGKKMLSRIEAIAARVGYGEEHMEGTNSRTTSYRRAIVSSMGSSASPTSTKLFCRLEDEDGANKLAAYRRATMLSSLSIATERMKPDEVASRDSDRERAKSTPARANCGARLQPSSDTTEPSKTASNARARRRAFMARIGSDESMQVAAAVSSIAGTTPSKAMNAARAMP
eukprot:g9235.t1